MIEKYKLLLEFGVLVLVLLYLYYRGIPLTGPRAESMYERVWPNLEPLRRSFFPKLERMFPVVKFITHANQQEFAGVIKGKTPDQVSPKLRDDPDVYPVNLAALKYIDKDGKPRRYERASYAYRDDGFFGRYQTHIRLFEHPQGTAVYAHYEVSPLAGVNEGLVQAIKDAINHYTGEEWNGIKGVRNARILLGMN